MPRHIDRFEQFSKHIPKLLRRQLIVSSLRQLKQIDGIDSIEHKRALSIDTTTASDDPYILTCAPSLERFHAVLLFIDISGFTMLSQKLHVDQLHKEINAYFKQLIDIIELCQGEVIKFAGDAMFVVWQTPVCSLEDGSFVHACQQQVEQAIYCAKRINLSCSDYKIDFLHPQDGHVEHICLNVHSGLSVGLMAGIDIGAMDRWEYFIIGKPLQEAAEAESHATNGQLLISQVAHDILHPANTPCTCQVMSNCCYLVTDLCTKSTAFMQEVWSAKKNAIVNEYEEYLEYDCRLYNDILADISQAERAVLQCGILKRKKLDFVMNGIQGSLLDNIVRHCHEVVRVAYTFVEDWIKDSPTSQFAPTPGSQLRDGFFEGDEDISYPSLSSSTSLQSTATDSKTIASKRPNSTHTKHSFVSKLRKVATNRMQTLKEKYQARNERGMFTDSSLLADQREAIVMFINIALPKIELFQSNTASSLNNQANVTTKKVIEVASFHFLQRTEDELKADQQLVDRLQQCYDAIMLAVHTFHGQLRQFIVDDKGTVCIVSFGMRGSMKNHTASDAVEASKMIVTSLNAIQVQASIGLTSGKVYGGLVGSPKRHEYAVMGPSVNLAARLMGKCILNDTLCDHEVSARDSMHHFFSKGTIIAKGYSAAVPTYSPIFATMFTNLEVQFHHLQHLQNVTELVRYHSKTMSTQHAGTLERSATGLSNTSPAVTKRKPPLHHSAHSAHKKIPPRRKLPHHQLRPDSFRNFIAYGREAESQQVYEVFLKYAKDMGDNIELVKAELLQAATINSIIISPGSQSRDVHRSKHQFARECFDNQQPPSTILILGSTGIGKTHFCQSIFSHLNHLLDNSTFSNWNLLMVSNLGLMKSAEVFHDWRYIIVELLAKLTDTQALISHEQADLVSSLNSFMKPHEKANVALQYLMKKLSWQSQEGFKYFLEFFPVFQEIDCSPYRHQQHATFDKSSIEKIGIVMKLLIELLGLIVEESKCLICIWM